MNDEEQITADRLRIVVNNDAAEPKDRPTKSTPKLKRRFAQISLEWLSDPAWRGQIAPALRLYLVVQFATRRGARTVRLTNDMAAEAGIDRHRKSRLLAQLEARGWVKVSRDGNRNPEVCLMLAKQAPMPSPPSRS